MAEVEMRDMGIGGAVARMREGRAVAREGWGRGGGYLALARGLSFGVHSLIGPGAASGPVSDAIMMRSPGGPWRVWTATQEDILAKDWHIEVEV